MSGWMCGPGSVDEVRLWMLDTILSRSSSGRFERPVGWVMIFTRLKLNWTVIGVLMDVVGGLVCGRCG